MSNKNIDRMHAHSGRYIKENDKLVNVADIANRLNQTLTALSGVQVSEPYPIIGIKSNYGKSALRDTEELTGSGSVSNNVGDGVYVVGSGNTSNSSASLSTVERGRYVSGSIAIPGIGIRIPQVLEGQEVARWGYFNEDNGFGFGYDVDGLYVFLRNGGSDTIVRRAAWVDKMDGAGASGETVNVSNVDIYRMPFRWYGSGPVNFEVSGTGGIGETVTVATIHALAGKPIVDEPNLPLRVEILNDESGRDINIEVYGRQFSVLGRYDPNRRVTGEFRLSQSVGSTFVPLVSFRQKEIYKSVSIKSNSVNILTSNSDLIVQIRIGSSLTGASFSAPALVPAGETSLEFDSSSTAISGGQVIYTGLSGSGAGSKTQLSSIDLPDVDLPSDKNITLCARSVSGTATVTSVFQAMEEW